MHWGHEPKGDDVRAPASWTAAVLCRFSTRPPDRKRQKTGAVQNLAVHGKVSESADPICCNERGEGRTGRSALPEDSGDCALLTTIKQCWLSLYSERALAYLANERPPAEKALMAVVVQAMVPADFAGVFFTIDPVSGSASRMVIEATQGLGDRLVSGQVNPECIVLEKATLRVILRRTASAAPHLDDAFLRRLGKLGQKAEHLFGRPLDMEWGMANGKIFLLQARPITTARPARSWEGRQIWSNLNTGEVAPDVMTPATWSMIRFFLGRIADSVFRIVGADMSCGPVVGLVAGRIYFNANTGLAALKPFSWLVRRIPNFAQALGGGHIEFHRQALLEIPHSRCFAGSDS